MSTSPSGLRKQGAAASLLRTVLVVASLVAVASSTSAFADLDAPPDPEANQPTIEQPLPEVLEPPQPEAAPEPVAPVMPEAECSRFFADFCKEIPPPPSQATSTHDPSSCRLPTEHLPEGATSVVIAPAATVDGSNTVVRYQVEVEDGLAIESGCFAESVAEILNDPRGWTRGNDLRFELVDDGEYDFRLILASPSTTDALCYPAGTGGKYSCRNRDKVVLNLMRWEFGADEFEGQLYRQYLVNHEVGHFLGHRHRSCPGSEATAPVMMQQTKGLDGCRPNGWPTEDER